MDMAPELNRVLFYIPVGNDTSLFSKLHDVIETLGLQEQSEIYRTIDDLTRRLCCPEGRPQIGVILAPSPEDLMEVLSIQDLLHNLRTLLILPDNEYDTVTQGHTLRPRFLTDTEGNFGDLAEVLRKIRKGHQ
jgi:hypothetical protein